jgi:hypothetical protein
MSDSGHAGWSRQRLWLAAFLLFAAQVGLIFWFSDRKPIQVRQVTNVPHLEAPGQISEEWVALMDPTLFALPHAQGFSGPAWMELPKITVPQMEDSGFPEQLPITLRPSEDALDAYLHTNRFARTPLPIKPAPEMLMPEPPALAELRPESSLRLTGELAGRPLLTPFNLPDQPLPTNRVDVLTNSVVQVLVDAEGRPLSIALLAGCGLVSADTFAMQLARTARFEPLPGAEASHASITSPNPAAGAALGQLIFEWRTVPPRPATP